MKGMTEREVKIKCIDLRWAVIDVNADIRSILRRPSILCSTFTIFTLARIYKKDYTFLIR